ncbi:hypothetical protein, partial [Verrucomicrobium sp. BvORR034]|uniref:hypothetical protein n=1 Tax=Verrucomicrobium sp. BvORR034 TaxID=1396418 RepID=UPI002240FB80
MSSPTATAVAAGTRQSTASNFPHAIVNEAVLTPAFILGVTGNNDPAGYVHWPPTYSPGSPHPGPSPLPAIQAVRDAVFATLDWLLHTPTPLLFTGRLDPHSRRFLQFENAQGNTAEAYHAIWQPLGLGTTPIVVLSSLAPGVDTLVVEAVFAYKKWHPEARITVRAPLPFPEEIYAEASSFSRCTPDQNPLGVADAPKRRLQHLLELIKSQDGFCPERDLFCVPLHPDVSADPDYNPTGDPAVDLTAGTTTPVRFTRRNIRYRAAGEYIAAYSDVLLAIYDETHDTATPADLTSLQNPGAAVITLAKRRGLTDGLLPIPSIIAWADTGPVLHVPIDRAKTGANGLTLPHRPLRLLQPYDAQPDDLPSATHLPEHHPRWQENGHRLLQAMVRNLHAYQHLLPTVPTTAAQREEALRKLFTGSKNATTHDRAVGIALSCTTSPFGTFARLRDLTADVGNGWGKRADHLHLFIVGITVASLFLFVLSTTNLVKFSLSESASGILRGLAFAIATGSSAVAWLLHRGHNPARLFQFGLEKEDQTRVPPAQVEDRQFDYRIIAEGMRVQAYWSISGLYSAVASRYIQRLRGELGWIRGVVSSFTFPYLRTRQWFLQQPLPDQLTLLEAVQKGWIQGQSTYFSGTVRKHTLLLESWEGLGRVLLSAAFLLAFQALYMDVCGEDRATHDATLTQLTASSSWALFIAALLLLVPFQFWLAERLSRGQRTGGKSPLHLHFWRVFFPTLWMDEDEDPPQGSTPGSTPPSTYRPLVAWLRRTFPTQHQRETFVSWLHFGCALALGT